jgi:hypothetical protein
MPILNIVWSPINQAWFVMFGSSLLRIFNSKQDALDYVAEISA